MNTQRTIIIIVALLAVSAVVWQISASSSVFNPPIGTDDTTVACTEEAMICSDGSVVGRTGPNCAFADCPSISEPTTTSPGTPAEQSPKKSANQPNPSQTPESGRVRAPVEITLEQGQTKDAIGLDITLVSINDSRCPSDVQCIWAGTASATVKLGSDNKSKTVTLTLGSTPTTQYGYDVSAIDISPLSKSGTTTEQSKQTATIRVASSYTNIVDNPDYVVGSKGSICIGAGGTWDGAHSECGGITENSCTSIKGVWNECGSACRHNPNAEMCTMQCVQFCQM